MTQKIVHMLQSLYYPTATALHKDAMQCSDIALETLGFTRGREPKAPLSPLGAQGSLTALHPSYGDTFYRNTVHWVDVRLLGSQCTS